MSGINNNTNNSSKRGCLFRNASDKMLTICDNNRCLRQSMERTESMGNLSSSQRLEKQNKQASSFLQVQNFQEANSVAFSKVQKLWIMIDFEAVKQDLLSDLVVEIVVCIDISGSMKDGKLAHLIATMEYFFNKLQPHHRICIIAFNQEIHMLSKGLINVTSENKDFLLKALQALKPTGSTNIGDALFKALDVLKNREPVDPARPCRVSSVMLFTDGLANVGLRGREFNDALRRTHIPSDVVINTFGFGDHDSTMLRNIALSSCGGVYHYIPHVEAIPAIFGECLAGLLNTVLYDVNVSLQACDGCRIVRFCTSYPINEKKENKDYEISFGTMFRYEKKSLLFRVSLKKLVGEWESHPLLTSTISFRTVNNGKLYQISNKFQVSRPGVCPEERIPEGLDVQINRILAAQAFDQAIVCGNKSDYDGAVANLQDAIQSIRKSVSAKTKFCLSLVNDLTSCCHSMKEKLTFASGIHFANAYSSTLYVERSSGSCMDDLSAIETKFAHTTNNNNNNNRSQTDSIISRYQTFDQLEESKSAQQHTATFLSNYVPFYDDLPSNESLSNSTNSLSLSSSSSLIPEIPTKNGGSFCQFPSQPLFSSLISLHSLTDSQ